MTEVQRLIWVMANPIIMCTSQRAHSPLLHHVYRNSHRFIRAADIIQSFENSFFSAVLESLILFSILSFKWGSRRFVSKKNSQHKLSLKIHQRHPIFVRLYSNMFS